MQEAIITCDRAIKIAPNAQQIYFLKANCLLGLGREEEALINYN